MSTTRLERSSHGLGLHLTLPPRLADPELSAGPATARGRQRDAGRRPRLQVAGEPLLVGHLMASAPARQAIASAGSTIASVALHAAILAVLVVVTSLPAARRQPSEPMTILRLADARPEPPPPPPPPPAVPVERVAPQRADAYTPRGFQTLVAPLVTPPDIPPPRPGAITNEADYTGVGQEGGTARGKLESGKVVTAEDLEVAPVFTPYTVAPELENRAEVQRALLKLYPAMLRDAGVTGTALVWILVDERGGVMRTQLQRSSGAAPLDDAALKVASVMRFTPALNRDVRVKVWVALPVTFQLGDLKS